MHRKLLDKKLGGSTDARFGLFGTSFTVSWALLAFSLSFYAVDGGDNLMPPSGWMIAAYISGAFGVLLLAFSAYIAVRWLRDPLKNTTSEELNVISEKLDKKFDDISAQIGGIRQDIRESIEEIRKDRG